MAWCCLVRLPNLLTVPGDVLAGFAVASALGGGSGYAGLVAVMGAVVLLYAAGLVLNDLLDLAEDAEARPGRPLPSGAISIGAARRAVTGMIAGAMGLLAWTSVAALAAGAVVAGLIFLYHSPLRRYRGAAAWTMGACRAGAVVVGMTAAAPAALVQPAGWVMPLWWMVYIAAVTGVARDELRSGPMGGLRWGPTAAVALGTGAMIAVAVPAGPASAFRAIMAFAFAALLTSQVAVRLGYAPGRVHAVARPAAVGVLISALLPIQAGVIILWSVEPWALLAALALLAAWPLNRWLARWVQAS
jgi:4-hydroxybenzoate polyprenyltransferase